ncbi:MAG: VOC family protein [Haloferacaceae archaeon]|jgi:lactoylglutathione lyase|nr:VOC family protein [Haloferacaceae archaeon]
MQTIAFDHVKLQVPITQFDETIAFYESTLGLPIEGRARFDRGEKPFVSARIATDSVIHIEPVERALAMADRPVDHLAIRVDAPIETIIDHCEAAGVPIDRRLDALGAVGEAPAVYIHDPTGMRVELKSTVSSR